jgi:hypothetical protein
LPRNWGLGAKGTGVEKERTMKRAFVRVPYAVLSRLLFDKHGIGIYRIEKDSPGPNGYVEFIVYGDANSHIERGDTYELYVNKKMPRINPEDNSAYQRKKV